MESKNLSLPVTLKGENYLLWARITKTFLKGKGLWGYVEPQTGPEAEETPVNKDAKWIQEDSQVLALLQSSLDHSILAAYSYSETAKELWDTLSGVYGNLSNISRIFEVKKELNDLNQEERSFKDMFGTFRGLWAEMEMLRPPTVDPKEITERREQDQVFSLLLALNDSFRGLIQHILRFEKLPNLNEVCMMIQKEEGSRGLFQTPSETSYMVRRNYAQGNKKVPVCEHCKKSGHLKERCWILNPRLKPEWYKGQGSRPVAARPLAAAASMEEGYVKKSDFESLLQSIARMSNSGKNFFASKLHGKVIVDSGASHHMIKDVSMLKDIKPYHGSVVVANGKHVPIEGIGNLSIFEKKTDALYIPSFTSNLLSVQKTTKDLDCVAVFGADNVEFQDNKSNKVLGKGEVKEGVYILNNEESGKDKPFAFSTVGTSPNWHARLGHPNSKMLHLVLPNLKLNDIECEACILGKQCRKVFPESSKVYKDVFELVHSDVWTAPCVTHDQYKYFVSFIDEKSKFTWVTLMSAKSQVLECFRRFYEYVLTQYNVKIKILRSDNGGEYISGQFKDFVSKKGIIHQTSCAYTPQQNGVAERKNRHIMETARTLMFEKGVPKRFWGDAVMSATYLINRLPMENLDKKSPFQILNKEVPNIDHLRIFGCRCYVFMPEGQRNKLEPKSIRCIFLGYPTNQKGYKCYNPESKRMYVSREVTFVEEEGYYDKKDWKNLEEMNSSEWNQESILGAGPRERVEPIQDFFQDSSDSSSQEEEIHSESEIEPEPEPIISISQSESIEKQTTNEDTSGSDTSKDEVIVYTPLPGLRRSQRQRFDPENWKNTRVYYNNHAQVTYPIQTYYSIVHLPQEHQVFLSKIDEERIPNTYEEACTSKVWIKAMNEELDSMARNETWEMSELPKGKKLVGCRWVYTIKYKSSGEIERYKARLVAKGYTQVYGEDYTETFAPVAKLHSVRVLLSIAINLSWELWQMDVKNAFLQGDLEEEVYMALPQGVCGSSDQVCKLKKAIYGLKQSPRAWYHRLSSCLLEKGFEKSEADHTLFIKKGKGGIVVILIYVDDIIISGNDQEGIRCAKKELKAAFEIKDLGELKYFLGIEMNRSENGMFISQRKYVLDLLSDTGKIGSKPAKTPLEEGYQDYNEGEPLEDIKQYQRLVGKLIYLTITRPDICFAVGQVSQHMQKPMAHHWSMMERILRYLKGSPGKGIWLEKNGSTELIGYCDADYAGNKLDRRSTSGYCTFVGGNLVTWRSKKQKVVALSSAEAEYRAMKEIAKELMWLRGFLRELGVNNPGPTTLYCDNQAALHIASNPVFHERTKHIEVDCHFVREKIQNGTIQTAFVKSVDQVADIFTKATNSLVGNYIQGKIGLLDMYQPILRGSVEIAQTKSDQDKGKALECNTGIWEVGECSNSSATNLAQEAKLVQPYSTRTQEEINLAQEEGSSHQPRITSIQGPSEL